MIVFDSLLAVSLLGLAWYLLTCRDLFRAVVLFVSLGMLMALAWVRLDAPDIAIAEVAIGSALTGALLFSALGDLGTETRDRARGAVGSLAAMAGGLVLVIILGAAIWDLRGPTVGLRDAAAARVGETGVENPVTAVLLAFRSYDTLLEVAVLLVACLAVLCLGPGPTRASRGPVESTVLDAVTRALHPILILIAAYLLWVGAYEPGGAFQAGSVLGGSAILAWLAASTWHERLSPRRWRVLLCVGLAVYVSVAGGTLLAGVALLEYRGSASKWIILGIESAATLSIAATLFVLLIGRTGGSVSEESS